MLSVVRKWLRRLDGWFGGDPPGDRHDYRAIYEHLSIGIGRATIGGRMICANPALVRLNGYASEAELIAGVNDIASEWYVEPGRRDEFKRLLARDGAVEGFVSEIYRHKTRERIWVLESARVVRDERSGVPLFYECTIQEITETHRRLEVEERFRKIAAEVPGCLYQYRMRPDGSTHFPYVSEGIMDLFGVTPEEVAESTAVLFDMVHPDDLEGLLDSNRRAAQTLTNWSDDYRIIMPDGSVKWIHGNSSPEPQPDGSIMWYGFMNDITERKLTEQKVAQLAYQDHLTGLPNRRLFRDRLGQSIERAQRTNRPGVLLFIDLDGFKTLNDKFGHETGDQLLIEVAGRLKRAARATDTVARLGGDEFVVVAGDLPPEPGDRDTAVERLKAEIEGTFGAPFHLAGRPMRVSASVGACVFHGDDAGADEILGRADKAMYAAKASQARRRLADILPLITSSHATRRSGAARSA